MEQTLYNLCWHLLCVTPKTDLKMKSISQEREREWEREWETMRERELECKENRIIIQTLSKSNTHSQGNCRGKTPVTMRTTITALQGSPRRDVKGCKGTYSSGFSLVFTSIEAKRDDKRENVLAEVENICGTRTRWGLWHISCSVPVNGACLRLSFNVCVCVYLMQTKYLKTVEGCSTNHQRKAEAASASGASELSSCSLQGIENTTKIVDVKIKVRVSPVYTRYGRRSPAARCTAFCFV